MLDTKSVLSVSCGQSDFRKPPIIERVFVVEELQTENNTITAQRVSAPLKLNAIAPASERGSATPIRFASDWQGKNYDSELNPEVRALCAPAIRYLRSVCRSRELYVFSESDPTGRRPPLWE